MTIEYDDLSFIDTCALRFDGYRYAADRGDRMGPELVGFPGLVDRVEKTLEFYENPLDNLAVFFALQRFLGKWGGETLPNDAIERIVFKMLFLHLYREEIPERYRFLSQNWYRKWEMDLRPVREDLAARVRRTLVPASPKRRTKAKPTG